MKRVIKPLAIVVLLAALALGFRHFRAGTVPSSVPTAAAQKGEFLVTVKVRGTLVARHSVALYAPNVSGLQIVWLAPTGSTVQAGRQVVRFDSSTARQTLNTRLAALAQAKAALDQAVATKTLNDQQDTMDLATAGNNVKSAELDASKAAIVDEIDAAESKLALGMAQEKLKVEHATIAAHNASNDAKIASATRLRDKAQADLDLIQDQLKEMEITAPLTGVVNYLMNYSQGWANAQPFKAGDNVWATAELAEIPDLSSLLLVAKISEVDRGRVQQGNEVRLHLDALPEVATAGKITALSELAESDCCSQWPPPMVFRLNASLNSIDPRMRPDMAGSVDVVTKRIADAISVPAAAVFSVGGRPVVYVERGGKFDPVAVTVQASNADEMAVVGVNAGTRVALVDPNAVAAGSTGAPSDRTSGSAPAPK